MSSLSCITALLIYYTSEVRVVPICVVLKIREAVLYQIHKVIQPIAADEPNKVTFYRTRKSLAIVREA